MGVRHVVLSGCFGGGKSILLAERGFKVASEPGRRIVRHQSGGTARAGGQAAGCQRLIEKGAYWRLRLLTNPVDYRRGFVVWRVGV
jgi:hypothetical protein